MTKSKKFKTPARASIFYLLGTVGSRAIGILVTPIFTRAMDEGEFGLYSYYISILGIVSMISGIFLAPAVFYSGLGKFKGEKEDFSKTAILLSISINALICTLLFAFNPYLGLNLQLIAILTLQGAVDIIINSELMKSKFSYNYGRVLAINLSTSILSAAISVFLVLHLGMGAIGRAIGLLLPGAAVCLIAFPRRREKKTKNPHHASFLLKNSIPLIPAILSRAAMGSVDKLIVRASLGEIALAKYSIAHTVGTVLFALIGALSNALNPWLIRKLSLGRRDLIFPVIENISAIVAWGSAAVITLSPEIFSFLAPESYRDAVFAIAPIALCSVPYFLFTVATVVSGFSERTHNVSISASIGAAINLILNILLIPRLSYLGGGIAYFAAEAVMLLSLLLLMGRRDKDAAVALLGGRESWVALAFGCLMPLFYKYPALRILLLSIPLCLGARRGFKCLTLSREK